MTWRFYVGFSLFCLINISVADEIRPGYLEIKETSQNVFSVLWKMPAKGNKKVSSRLSLPDKCIDKVQPISQLINGSYIERSIIVCKDGIVGKNISIPGLVSSNTDILLRMEFLDSLSLSALLTPEESAYQIPSEKSSLQIIDTYTWLGLEHILQGVDHLLFVFALILIVSSKRRLLWTITAFTLAHSITLASATLGVVQVPQQPIEAIIALSILFLAVEIVHSQQGKVGAAARWPWLIAFIFGLLHGFGFAGALVEIGLPQQAIPLALVFFNVGVELGQLLFVAGVLLVGWLLRKFTEERLIRKAETIAVYFIGSVSAFWVFERVSAY